MSARSRAEHHHHDKAKVTIDCTVDERAYKDKPNKKTIQTIQDTKDGKTSRCESLEDFWDKMGVKPSAYN